MEFQAISASWLDWYADQEDVLIIDLRPRQNYVYRHIDGAVNIPFRELEHNMDRLPKNKTLVFYCQHGSQSLMACRQLSAMGYRTLSVTGGLNYYRGNRLVFQSDQR